MLVMVEDRQVVAEAYTTSFSRIGITLQSFVGIDFANWFQTTTDSEIESVDGFLIGHVEPVQDFLHMIRVRNNKPVMAILDIIRIDSLVKYYELGMDDVLRKPVHVREIACRLHAIQRRISSAKSIEVNSQFHVFFDGRNPIVGGYELELPRRERRLLEFLVARAGRRVTKEQVFNGIYGIFEDNLNECVVESHVSKLRKKLRERLGYDPIDAKRFLGYCLRIPGIKQNSGMSSLDTFCQSSDLDVKHFGLNSSERSDQAANYEIPAID